MNLGIEGFLILRFYYPPKRVFEKRFIEIYKLTIMRIWQHRGPFNNNEYKTTGHWD